MFPSSAASGHVPSHGQGLLVEDHLMISFYSQQFLFPNMSYDLNSANPHCNPALETNATPIPSLGDHYCGASSNCQISLVNNQWPWRSTSEEAINTDRGPWSSTSEEAINKNGGEGPMVDNSVRTKKAAGGRRKMREPRFCFKTMSEEVDVLDDGYKWRKYGQKTVKDTRHPRSYYRCTRDKCQVKKRVERLAEDPRMVITTYEGRHIHSPPDVILADRDDVIQQAASSRINFFRKENRPPLKTGVRYNKTILDHSVHLITELTTNETLSNRRMKIDTNRTCDSLVALSKTESK